MTGRRRSLATLTRILRAEPELLSPWFAGRSQIDWESTIAMANEHLMGPAVYAALERAGTLRATPRDVRSYLALLYRANRHRNRVIRRQLDELVAALNHDGMEPLLLKGAVIIAGPTPMDPAARMMADIDVAVQPNQRQRAIDTLHRLGYVASSRYPDGHHAYGEFTRGGDPAAVDLHFELVDQADVLPAAEVWRRSRRHELREGVFCAIPGATDRLFHHLLHAQLHYRGNFYRGHLDLRQLYEFDRLAADAVDWIFIEDRLRGHKLLTPLYSYLLAAGELFGTRWPYDTNPSWQAQAHVKRCLATLRFPTLRWTGIPWGNLRGAFAWHRMERLYRGDGVPKPLRRLHHLRRILRRHPVSFPFHRTFRF